MEARVPYDTAVVCKRHVDEWLHRYKPTKCAACPQPLTSSGSMPCPEWMRKQLAAQHGAFVHKRPCYETALAAKNQQAADTQPIAEKQATISPCQSYHSRQSAMRRHRSICACTSTLTCSSALLVCNSSAQATSPSLLVTTLKWATALFIIFRPLQLPYAAAPGCLLSGCNHPPSSYARKQFAPAGVSRLCCCVLLGSEIAAADRPLLVSTPQAPAPHGDPKPQQSIHLA
jgi:hypothetical protein